MQLIIEIPDENIVLALYRGVIVAEDDWEFDTISTPTLTDNWPLYTGTISFIDPDQPDDALTVDYEAIVRGLKTMSIASPEWFMNLFEATEIDPTTADVFLQYCLYGELIFG